MKNSLCTELITDKTFSQVFFYVFLIFSQCPSCTILAQVYLRTNDQKVLRLPSQPPYNRGRLRYAAQRQNSHSCQGPLEVKGILWYKQRKKWHQQQFLITNNQQPSPTRLKTHTVHGIINIIPIIVFIRPVSLTIYIQKQQFFVT